MRIGLSLGVAVAMISASALAQEAPTGSRLGSRYSGSIKYSEEEADTAATKLTSCLVSKREVAARAFIDAYSVDESDKQYNALWSDVSCLSLVGISGMSDTTQLTFPRDVLRGKLAEALLKGKSSTIAALPVIPLAKDYSRPWFAATSRNPVIDEMGVCVADTNPGGIARILSTDAYSKEEAAAFGAVVPSLGTCLRAGAKLQANRQALRAALADAVYQRLARPAPAAQLAAAEVANQQIRIAFKKFADCVVTKKAQDAYVYVIEDVPDAQFDRLRERMRDEVCWKAMTGLQPPVVTNGLKLQGMIAEALMARETDRGPLQQLNAISPLTHETVTEEDRQKSNPEDLRLLTGMLELFSAGECIVRADVNGSHALLKTDVATTQESDALMALKPAFGSCIKVDPSYALTSEELRAAVAVNYYRLGHPRKAATVTGTAGGAK